MICLSHKKAINIKTKDVITLMALINIEYKLAILCKV